MKMKMDLPNEYVTVFDASNVNWLQEPVANYLFLKSVQQHMNNVLEVRGHLFLNDVFDSLHMPRTAVGAIVGWFKEEGSNYIDFHLPASPDETRESVSLTFNPDGVIWDKLP